MKLSEDQFRRQRLYQAALSAISRLREEGVLTEEEAELSVKYLQKKYCPIIRY